MANLGTYYVVACDYGRDGREAVVDFNHSRSNIISNVSTGQYSDIIAIHEVTLGEPTRDVTAEILAAAQTLFVEDTWVEVDQHYASRIRNLAGAA